MNNPFALIVEDNDDLAAIFDAALQTAGFKTEVIQAGDSAIAWLASGKPDIVLLDLNLPRVSGEEILRYIRAEERLTDTKVVVATAFPRMAETLKDEADLVLIKPVSFVQLRDLAMRFGMGLVQ